MPNPFDQFDQPGTTATATANPFDQFDTVPQAPTRAERRGQLVRDLGQARAEGESLEPVAKTEAGGLLAQAGLGLSAGFAQLGEQANRVIATPFRDVAGGFAPVDLLTPALSPFKGAYTRQLTGAADVARQAAQDVEALGAATGGPDLMRKGTAALISIAPILATAPLAAGSVLPGAVAAGLQSYGSTLGDAEEAYRQRGDDNQTAYQKAILPAVASGAVTALITRLGGATGPEAIKQAMQTGTWRATGREFARQVGFEAAEEWWDQVGQSAIAKLTYRPDLTLEQAVGEATEAGLLGGLVGGVVQVARQTGPRTATPPPVSVRPPPLPLEVDELPAPQAAVESQPLKVESPEAAPLSTFNLQPSTPLSPATPPTGAVPAPTAEVAPPVLSPAAPLTLEPVAEVPEVPGVPAPLEGQPYEVESGKLKAESPEAAAALSTFNLQPSTRGESAMETRRAAPLNLQREPAVSPDLADAIAAVRAGYQPEVEAQQPNVGSQPANVESQPANVGSQPANVETPPSQRRYSTKAGDDFRNKAILFGWLTRGLEVSGGGRSSFATDGNLSFYEETAGSGSDYVTISDKDGTQLKIRYSNHFAPGGGGFRVSEMGSGRSSPPDYNVVNGKIHAYQNGKWVKIGLAEFRNDLLHFLNYGLPENATGGPKAASAGIKTPVGSPEAGKGSVTALQPEGASALTGATQSLSSTAVKPTPPVQSGGPTELTPPAKAGKLSSRRGAAAGGTGTITGSNERRGSEMPAEAGSTPVPTEGAAPRRTKQEEVAARKTVKAAAQEFDRLVLEWGAQLGWVKRPELMAQRFAREGLDTVSIKAKILQGEELKSARTRAASTFARLTGLDMSDPADRAKLLPQLKEYLAPRMAEREQSQQFDQKVIQGQRPAGQEDSVQVLSADSLRPGDTFTVQGHGFTVEQVFTGEDGRITGVKVQDGPKFGVQTVGAEDYLHIDFDSLERGEPPAGSDFALNEPESVEEQKARLAQEQAQRDAQAQRAKLAELQAKPLQGTTGDLGQGSLLDAPQDLFAPPSAVDSAIAALESAKVKPGGPFALPDLGLTVTLWNGTLTAAQLALRAGRSLAQSIQAGVDWLRAQGQPFDEAKVRAALEQGILQAPGIREHVGKRLLQEDLSPAAKAALEPLLRHEVKPDAQLFAEAAAVVEAIGPMEAEANYWGNPWGLPADAHVVLGFAIGNGLSTLEAQARAAGDTALADRIGRQNAEFQSQFVLQSTETARTLRAYRYFDLVGNLSPFTADLFARKAIEQAGQKQKHRLKPTLDAAKQQLDDLNRTGIEEAARTPEVQGAARTVINQTVEEEAERKDTAVQKAITLEVSNTLETLPSVVRKANAAVLGAWDKLAAGEQVRQQAGRAGQALENALWSAIKQRGGAISTVSSVIAQVNRALHEQVNRTLGVTPQQFVNPTTYLMRLRDALGNAEVMSRIWEQTRAAVGNNLAAIDEMERLLVRIEEEIVTLEAEAKTPLAGGPEVTAKDAKLKAQQQAARDEMLKGRNANIAEAIKQRRARIADVSAQLAEYRKMQPAWQAVMGMTVDVWGPNLLRGLLREQMKTDGFRLRKATADHFRGLAGAADPLAGLGTLTQKIIAASGLDEQAAGRLAKDLEAEYTRQVEQERARLAERLAKARERAKAKAAEREANQPKLDAEALIDAYERRQTEWLKPEGRKSAVRAIVRQALREGAAVAGLNEQVVRGGLQAQLEAVGVPHEAAYRLASEVWQDRQAKGGGIDAVVAARVKQLQLDLGRVIRQHWTQVDKAAESLAEHIVGETKMPAEQAERLAAAIQRRFKALVQARKEKALRNLAKTPGARELQKPTVAQRIIEATNLGALDNEGLWQAVAEKLGLPTYTAEASAEVKRLAERAQQLPEGSVQRQEATARLMRFIARQKSINRGDLGWAFWYANTLSGPITHAVNTFSNTLSLAANVAAQFRDVRGIPQILAATADGFRTGLTEARAIVKQGPGAHRTKFAEQGQALENLDPQDFTGAGLVQKWRYVARALAAADAAFYFPAREAKAITLARALARQEGKTGVAIRTRAQQLIDGTEEQQNLWGAQVDRERAQLEAMGEQPDALWTTRRLEQLREQNWGADIGEAADDFALRTTYNNQPYGFIGQMAEWVKNGQRRVPGARGVVPFVNVVANVVNDSINYTPWGFARAYAASRTGEPSVTLSLPFEWAEKLREGKSPMTPDAVVDLHAKAALGTVMVGSLMAMALAGLDDDDGENFQLYGAGPKDAAAKAALRETGWLPYSVRVNGKYLSFANTPLAIPLGALGHYLDAARYDKRFEQADAFNRLGVALWGGAHIITQQSFLDGLARLLGALEERRGRMDTASDRAVEQAFRTVSSVAVPNALRQLDRLFDPTIYDARGIEGALVAGIPFARRNARPALNAFGEPITNEPWKRFASDAEASVWTDLARRKIYPSVADKAKNANGREMTDDEHYRYVQESGQAIKRRLEAPGMRQMIQNGKEDDARKAVTAIVREERERARRRLGF